MPDHTERLKQRVDDIQFNGGKLTKAEALDLFRLVRRILEQDGSGNDYPTLSLYSNWLMHDGIHRHPEAYRILEQIGAALAHYADGDTGLLVQAVNHLIGLKALRSDLLRLFEKKNVSTSILQSRITWHMVATWVVEDLLDSEVSYPDDIETRSKTSVAYKSYLLAKSHAIRTDWFVRSFKFVDERVSGNDMPGFHWVLRISPKGPNETTVRSVLKIDDFSDRFERP